MPEPLDPLLALFASPEEQQKLQDGSLARQGAETLLAELRRRLDVWRASLTPTREQILSTTHDNNRRLVAFREDTPELWAAMEREWRDLQKPDGPQWRPPKVSERDVPKPDTWLPVQSNAKPEEPLPETPTQSVRIATDEQVTAAEKAGERFKKHEEEQKRLEEQRAANEPMPDTQVENPDSWAHLVLSSLLQKAKEVFEQKSNEPPKEKGRLRALYERARARFWPASLGLSLGDRMPEIRDDFQKSLGTINKPSLKSYWRSFTSALITTDRAIHDWIATRFPKALAFIDWLLVWVFGIISHGVFQLISALVLLVLALIGPNRIIIIATGRRWFLTILWIARSRFVMSLTMGARLLAIAFFSVFFGSVFYAFGNWAVSELKQQNSKSIVAIKTPASPTATTPLLPIADSSPAVLPSAQSLPLAAPAAKQAEAGITTSGHPLPTPTSTASAQVETSAQPAFPVAHVSVVANQSIPSVYEEFPIATRIVLQTTQTIVPAKFGMKCSGPIGHATAHIVGASTQTGSAGDPNGSNIFVFTIESPPFTPDRLLEVKIYSATKLNCNMQRMPP